MKINVNILGHMTKMAAILIYDKKIFKKSTVPKSIEQWLLNLIMQYQVLKY